MIDLRCPNPDKPEPESKPKGVSRKARRERKENHTSWFLKTKDTAFLGGLGGLCEKISCHFEKNFIYN